MTSSDTTATNPPLPAGFVFCLVLLCIGFVGAGCSNSTGQKKGYAYHEPTQEQETTRETTRTRTDESDWAEHRRNFGERRASTRDWNETAWNSESSAAMEELKYELQELEELERLEYEFDELEELDEVFAEFGDIMDELGQALQGDADIEAVAYQDLKEVLPRSIPGMDMKDREGERVRVLGLHVSTYEQAFASQDRDQSVRIKVVDMGSLSDAASMGIDWLGLEVESEGTKGFERTTTVQGHPAFEECRRDSWRESCSLHMVVADRFILQLDGKGLSMQDLYDILDEVDIDRLETLRDHGM